MIGSRWKGAFVLALFFCSGATALVYEVVWSKFLGQMLGSTVQAQTVVLAVFMGGLALGNALFGRKADTLAKPLRAYGWVEICIGLYAFFFPSVYLGADALFIGLGSRLAGQGMMLLGLKALLSAALLLGPTLLMGGTLPLMASWLQRSCEDAGRRSARFYAVNSLGAVCGAGLAGFWLVQALGLVSTLQTAALLNVLVGALAILAGREDAPIAQNVSGERTTAGAFPAATAIPAMLPRAAWVVAATGGVSMGLEVLASRSLSLIFGSSLQSFAITLMAFIAGIGLGSTVMASPRWGRWQTGKVLMGLLTVAAVWIGLLVFNIESWVDVYRWAKSGIASSSVGYLYHVSLTAALAMVLLGVPAGLLGAVLPMMIRSISGDGLALGRQVGRLLTWNTLGAVFGVLFTGFILMPRAGLRVAFGVLALVLCAVAAWAARRGESRPATEAPAGGTWKFPGLGALFPAGAAVLLLWMLVGSGEGWRHVMASGAFRSREKEADFSVMERRKQHVKILFYEDAPDATVTVERGDGIGAPAETGLRINGKPDASSHGDLGSQLLLAHLPLLARPDGKDVFILGLGSGITGGAVLRHEVNRLVIAENCEPVARAAKWFEPWNGGVLTDPRASIRLEDARTVLKLSPQCYDVIITQPSNPWMAGVGSVFSQEFYELAASRLKEGGVVAQWFHTYEMHDGIVSLVLRTFGSVFPCVEVWDSEAGDIILLGSKRPWPATRADLQRGFARDSVRQDLTRIGITSPETLLARQLASQRTGFAILGAGPIQRDWYPVLEYEAPKAFHLGITSDLLSQFDERGAQWELASSEKTSGLRNLKDGELRDVFAQFATVNVKLRNYLSWRMGAANTDASAEPGNIRGMACVFRPSGPRPVQWFSGVANPEARSAAGVLERLNHDDDGRAARGQALLDVEKQLRAGATAGSSLVSTCAAEAARSCMARGEWARAQAILSLGLEADPNHSELQYLARILNREQHGTMAVAMEPIER